MTANHDPEIWSRINKPSRVLLAVGVAVWLAGGYMLAYAMGVQGVHVYKALGEDTIMTRTEPASPQAVLAMGIIYLLAGSAMLLGRRGIQIDKSRGRVTRWAGLMTPIWKSEFPLGPYRRVALAPHHKSGGGNERTAVAVRLAGDEGVFLDVWSFAKAPEALDLARDLALFLVWKVTDETALENTPGGPENDR